MRRRKVWAIFLPLAFVLGAGSIMFVGGLIKAFSFGMYTRPELQHQLAALVAWPAFGFAVLAHTVGAWRRRKRQLPHREAFGEVGQIAFAIFFGGAFALAHAHGSAWGVSIVAAMFLGYVLLDAHTPQTTRLRRVARAVAMLLVGTVTAAIIAFAAS